MIAAARSLGINTVLFVILVIALGCLARRLIQARRYHAFAPGSSSMRTRDETFSFSISEDDLVAMDEFDHFEEMWEQPAFYDRDRLGWFQ